MELQRFNISTSLLFLVLAVILFVKKSPNKKPNVFLGILFTTISFYTQITYLHFHLVEDKDVSALSHYYPVDGFFIVFMPPALYFFVMSLLGTPVRILQWKSLVHALPLIPCAIFNWMFCSWTATDRVNWLIRDFYSGSWQMSIINAALYLQVISYLVVSYRKVLRLQKLSAYVERDGYRTNVNWIRLFLLLNLVVTIISLPICFYVNNERASIIIGQSVMNIDLLFLFVLFSLKISHMDTEKIEDRKPSYQIDAAQAVNCWEILARFMVESKPYRDENCSLHSISVQTKIPEHQLSKTLNAHGGVSFADFINEYRLEEARLLLKESRDRKTMNEIAVGCGFGSRSSFYRAFRKSFEITPTAYRKQFEPNGNRI
ncbi:MAG TPA: helix-turn-helix domain-containing protein [Paludibacter sp.]|nr:helix-turn-helix domain-containing protein [Paludibacter sp.]